MNTETQSTSDIKECPACTFHNTTHAECCEICGTAFLGESENPAIDSNSSAINLVESTSETENYQHDSNNHEHLEKKRHSVTYNASSEPYKRSRMTAPQSPIENESIPTDGWCFFNNYIKGLEAVAGVNHMSLSFAQLLDRHLVRRSLADVVREGQLRRVMLSSYCFDQAFINPLLRDGRHTAADVYLVLHGGDERRGRGTSCEKLNDKVQVIYPSLPRFGVMHAKVVIAQFRDGTLRVGITSANLTEVDWEMYMQTIWFQDFHPSTSDKTEQEQDDKVSSDSGQQGQTAGWWCPSGNQDFGTYLLAFMREWGIPIQVINDMFSGYSFSSAVAQLVASVPGNHTSDLPLRANNSYGCPDLNETKTLCVTQPYRYGQLRLRALQHTNVLQACEYLAHSALKNSKCKMSTSSAELNFSRSESTKTIELIKSTCAPQDIVWQGSSLGALTIDQLLEMYRSANGILLKDDGQNTIQFKSDQSTSSNQDWLNVIAQTHTLKNAEAKERLMKDNEGINLQLSNILQSAHASADASLNGRYICPIRVLWPTRRYVLSSLFSWRGAGMEHFRRAYWDKTLRSGKSSFPKKAIHKFSLRAPWSAIFDTEHGVIQSTQQDCQSNVDENSKMDPSEYFCPYICSHTKIIAPLSISNSAPSHCTAISASSSITSTSNAAASSSTSNSASSCFLSSSASSYKTGHDSDTQNDLKNTSENSCQPRKVRDWVYVGSANISAAAWGRVTKPTKAKPQQQKLYVSNYELGVLLPQVFSAEHLLSNTFGHIRPVSAGLPVNHIRFSLDSPVYTNQDTPWTSELLEELSQ